MKYLIFFFINLKTTMWYIFATAIIVISFTLYLKVRMGIFSGIRNLLLSMIKNKKKKDNEMTIIRIYSLFLLFANPILISFFVILAIRELGFGVIFWMWALSPIIFTIGYSESVLSQAYKKRIDSKFEGGPYIYLDKLNEKQFSFGILKKFFIFLFIFITLLYIIPMLLSNLHKFTYFVFDSKQIMFAISLIIIVSLCVFIITKKTFMSTMSFLNMFSLVMFAIVLVAMTLANMTLLLDFVQKILKDTFTLKIHGKYFIFVILGALTFIFYGSGTGPGFTSFLEGELDSKHPVEFGIVKMMSMYTIIIVSTLVAFVSYVAGPNFLDLQSSIQNSITMFLLTFQNGMGSSFVVIFTIIYIPSVIATMLIIYYNLKAAFESIKEIRKDNLFYKTFIGVSCVLIFILSLTQFSNVILSTGMIVSGFAMFLNIIGILTLSNHIKEFNRHYQSTVRGIRIYDKEFLENKDFIYWKEKFRENE